MLRLLSTSTPTNEPCMKPPEWFVAACKTSITHKMPDGYLSVTMLSSEEIAQNAWDALRKVLREGGDFPPA